MRSSCRRHASLLYTNRTFLRPQDGVLGPPHLAWSFNHDGQAKPGPVEARDERMDLDSGEARRERAGWAAEARRQAGVDALAGGFPRRRRRFGSALARSLPVVVMRAPRR